MVLFADAPCRKPNHAVVPLLTKDDNREIRAEIHLRRNRGNRLFDNLLFHRLTLLIQAVQVGGNGSRFGFVLRRQELDALFGGFEPPARVQPWRKAPHSRLNAYGSISGFSTASASGSFSANW